MQDWGQWDHYVEWVCPLSGVRSTLRCLGMATALAVAEQKRQLGFWRVKITHRRFARRKETQSYVSHGGLHG